LRPGLAAERELIRSTESPVLRTGCAIAMGPAAGAAAWRLAARFIEMTAPMATAPATANAIAAVPRFDAWNGVRRPKVCCWNIGEDPPLPVAPEHPWHGWILDALECPNIGPSGDGQSGPYLIFSVRSRSARSSLRRGRGE